MNSQLEMLKERKDAIEKTLQEAQLRLEKLQGSNSLAERTTQRDILQLKRQIEDVDALIEGLTFEKRLPVPRRDLFPISPTVLIDGIPPRNGIPSNARIIRKVDDTFHYVDAEGQVIPRS